MVKRRILLRKRNIVKSGEKESWLPLGLRLTEEYFDEETICKSYHDNFMYRRGFSDDKILYK